MTEYRIVERAGRYRAQYRDIRRWWPIWLTRWYYALEVGGHECSNSQPAEWDSYAKAEAAIVKMLREEAGSAEKWSVAGEGTVA